MEAALTAVLCSTCCLHCCCCRSFCYPCRTQPLFFLACSQFNQVFTFVHCAKLNMLERHGCVFCVHGNLISSTFPPKTAAAQRRPLQAAATAAVIIERERAACSGISQINMRSLNHSKMNDPLSLAHSSTVSCSGSRRTKSTLINIYSTFALQSRRDSGSTVNSLICPLQTTQTNPSGSLYLASLFTSHPPPPFITLPFPSPLTGDRAPCHQATLES